MRLLTSLMMMALGAVVAFAQENAAPCKTSDPGCKSIRNGFGPQSVTVQVDSALPSNNNNFDFHGLGLANPRVAIFYDFGYAVPVAEQKIAANPGTFVGYVTASDLAGDAVYTTFDILVILIGENLNAPWGAAVKNKLQQKISGGLKVLAYDRLVDGLTNYLPVPTTGYRNLVLYSDAYDRNVAPNSGPKGTVTWPMYGTYSSHGYIRRADVLALGPCNIPFMQQLDDATQVNKPEQTVSAEFRIGDGILIYSTIPMDAYLTWGDAYSNYHVNFANYLHYLNNRNGCQTCSASFSNVCNAINNLRGNLKDFNVYTLDGVATSNVQIDGRVGSRGAITLSGFSTGSLLSPNTCPAGRLDNDINQFSVVSYSDINLSNGRVYKGHAVAAAKNLAAPVAYGLDWKCPIYNFANFSASGFANQYFGATRHDDLRKLSKYLYDLSKFECGANAGSIYRICKTNTDSCNLNFNLQWGGLIVNPVTSAQLAPYKTFVLTVDGADWTSVNWAQLPQALVDRWQTCDPSTVFIVNVGGVNAFLRPGLPLYNNLNCVSQHTVFNFHQAQTLNTDGAVQRGLFLAPLADINVGYGDIYGDVIARYYRSNTHLGLGPFSCNQ